jgi:1-acyl-sn-glycerol-3-phosphate acyltransferase
MMFPEGTRSPDGHLRAFKPGAFELALKTQLPLLPILIDGTANALPKHGFVLRGRHRINVQVLDEIPYESFAGSSPEEVASSIRAFFARQLGEPHSHDVVAERSERSHRPARAEAPVRLPLRSRRR